MNDLEYWGECIDNAAADCGLVLTSEQHAVLVEAVSGGHECYSMAFGAPLYSHSSEIAELKRKLKRAEEAAQEEIRRVEYEAVQARRDLRDQMAGQISRLQGDLQAERDSKRDPSYMSRYR